MNADDVRMLAKTLPTGIAEAAQETMQSGYTSLLIYGTETDGPHVIYGFAEVLTSKLQETVALWLHRAGIDARPARCGRR